MRHSFWEPNGHLLHTLNDSATVLAFAQAGRLTMGRADGDVLVLPGPIPEPELLEYVAAHFIRELTPQERLDLSLEPPR